MLGDQDTIAAIGTARGVGALGIVRISGAQTPQILSRCFKSKTFSSEESHRASFGLWVDPRSQDAVDEVVVVNFTEGRGYTGEPSADVMCHGGVQVTEMVLTAALDSGARLARPGEFTYRAVMNGKLDLAKAEGVLELIRAKTPRAVANALNNIRGALSDKLNAIESDIIYVLANLEASIDFTTEDIQPVRFSEMRTFVQKASFQIQNLLETYIAGRVASQGIRVVLAGKPNSGKSSLLNALVGKSRSIVADLPGTTRDTVEEEVRIGGHLFRFVDTAGLRETDNSIEQQGVSRANDEIKGAEVVMYIVDSASGLSNDDAQKISEIGLDRGIICFNKSDLKKVESAVEPQRFGLVGFQEVSCSTVSENGTDALRQILASHAGRFSDAEMTSVISTQRQKQTLENSLAALKTADQLLMEEASPDLVSFELRTALLKVQEVLGKEVGDDVMDRVFKEFCIGK